MNYLQMNYLNTENKIGGRHFCVLDYTNPDDVDYKFFDLYYAENFQYPAAELLIGNYKILVPLNWHIIISEGGEVEIMEIDQLNKKDFTAFVYNPLSDYMPKYLPVSVERIIPFYDWTVPKIKKAQFFCLPLTNKEKPPCAYFIKDLSRLPSVIEIHNLI